MTLMDHILPCQETSDHPKHRYIGENILTRLKVKLWKLASNPSTKSTTALEQKQSLTNGQIRQM